MKTRTDQCSGNLFQWWIFLIPRIQWRSGDTKRRYDESYAAENITFPYPINYQNHNEPLTLNHNEPLTLNHIEPLTLNHNVP